MNGILELSLPLLAEVMLIIVPLSKTTRKGLTLPVAPVIIFVKTASAISVALTGHQDITTYHQK